MTDTLDLWTQPPYVKDSATSRAAAEAIVGNAATMRQQVYEWIYFNGPCSDEQIANGLGINPSSERPRRIELLRAGLIRPGSAPTITQAGRKAQTWTTVPDTHQGF